MYCETTAVNKIMHPILSISVLVHVLRISTYCLQNGFMSHKQIRGCRPEVSSGLHLMASAKDIHYISVDATNQCKFYGVIASNVNFQFQAAYKIMRNSASSLLVEVNSP